MLNRKSSTAFAAFAGMIAIGPLFWVSAASGGSSSPIEVGGSGGRAEYTALQNISYRFGSKAMSGYFVQQGATCLVTLMVIEWSDPDHLLPLTATRVRLAMNPGQVAGLDSEEGRSLNFTCDEGAKTLVVDSGDRSKLMSLQALSIRKRLADDP